MDLRLPAALLSALLAAPAALAATVVVEEGDHAFRCLARAGVQEPQLFVNVPVPTGSGSPSFEACGHAVDSPALPSGGQRFTMTLTWVPLSPAWEEFRLHATAWPCFPVLVAHPCVHSQYLTVEGASPLSLALDTAPGDDEVAFTYHPDPQGPAQVEADPGDVQVVHYVLTRIT